MKRAQPEASFGLKGLSRLTNFGGVAAVSVLLLALAAFASGCSDSDDAGSSGDAAAQPDGQGSEAVDDATPEVDVGGESIEADAEGGTKDVAENDAGGEDGSTVPDPSGPEVVSINPTTSAAAGGQPVAIEGTGFVSNSQVFFGASLAQNILVVSDKRILCDTPPHPPGLVDVRVQNPPPAPGAPALEAALENAFIYFNPVQITSIEPSEGHVKGGTEVKLIGIGFEPGSQVLFGPRPSPLVTRVSDTELVAVAPNGELGFVNVHVSNERGIGTLKQAYLYFAEPRIDAVSPAAGPVSGGNLVELTGTGFMPGVEIRFGGEVAEIVASDGFSRLRVAAPPGTAGPVDVAAETEFGTDTQENAYAYLNAAAPNDVNALIAVSPSKGPLSGGNQVQLVATGLTTVADTLVLFGAGQKAKVLAVDPSTSIAIVEAPPGVSAGAVDVTLANANGTSKLEEAYRYLSEVSVSSVTPPIGPVAGGTSIVVKGKGFAPGARVFVGALEATSVSVTNSTTLSAITPPGAAGYAAVRVTVDDVDGVLPQGFFYQTSGMAIFVVDPNVGSIAGGTFVQIVGQGFSGNAQVRFDGNAASHISVVDSTLITCKTPPGQVGTIAVEVQTAAGTVFLPDAFTYFNPENSLGGTWGTDVVGALNITVRDADSGAPVSDAFVILGTSATTPYQGFSNLQGQITFSGPDVGGEQMVSVSKAGYESNTVKEFNAENLTILLKPIPPPTPGAPPPGVAPPLVSGRLFGLSKYTLVPIGSCANKFGAPAPLCQSCTEDAQCGANAGCVALELNSTQKFCATNCSSDTGCPSGFVCGNAGGQPRCLPSPGQKVARCGTTKPHIFADGIEDLIGEPGPDGQWQVFDEGDTYTVYAYPGNVTVLCMGGYVDFDTAEFVPLTMGVARNVATAPGVTTEDTDIQLAYPMTRNIPLSFSNTPKAGPEGPSFTGLFTYLDFGLEGVFEMKHALQTGVFGQPMVLPRQVAELTGALIDVSFTFFGGGFSMTADNTPVSLALARNVTQVENDTAYTLEGGEWKAQSTGINRTVRDVFSPGPGALYGVGDGGLVAYWAGNNWTAQASDTDANLNSVWGFGDGSAIAVGDAGTILTFGGALWKTVPGIGTAARLNGVWGSAPNNVYAVGQFEVVHWNGTTWNANPLAPVFQGTAWDFQAIHGTDANHIWIVGRTGRVTSFNGLQGQWTTQQLPGIPDLFSVWAVSPEEVYAVGAGGVIFRFDGTVWAQMESPTTETLRSVWASGPGDVVAVGDRGTILRFNGVTWTSQGPEDNLTSLNAVWGFGPGSAYALGSSEFILGPLLEVPVPISPTNGSILEEYELTLDFADGYPASFQYLNLTIPGLMGDTPEWFIFTAGDVKQVSLPNFPVIEGTPGIAAGAKNLLILRAYKPGFDMDNYDYTDLNTLEWRAWAYDALSFIKP
jgi:hypothetical protein